MPAQSALPSEGAEEPRATGARVSQIPQMQAHWHAAAKLPAEHAVKIGLELTRMLHARQQQLESVLDEYGVDAAARDKRKLTCGLRGISYVELEDEGAAAWRVGERSYESLGQAIAEWHATAAWRNVDGGQLVGGSCGDSDGELVVFSDQRSFVVQHGALPLEPESAEAAASS